MTEIYGCVETSLAHSEQEIGDEWEQVMVLLGDFVESPEINTEAKGAVLFTDEQNGSSMGGLRRPDETNPEMLVNEFPKCTKLRLGEGIHYANGRGSIFFKVNL